MKKVRFMSTMFIFISLLFTGMSIDIHAIDENIIITTPSEKETMIEPGRDFYVSGTLHDLGDLTGASMSVKLSDKDGNIVREITGQYGIQPMKTSFPKYYGEDASILKDSKMPELIWDGTNEASFRNGDIKLYFDDDTFTALIIGGTVYDNGLGFVDQNNTPYTTLAAGNYTIIASVNKAGTSIAQSSKDIVLGSTKDKMLARFSPSTHLERVNEFADVNHIRMYLDAFPGYWSKGDLFTEVLKEWRGADALEYTTGKVHFVIYNVKKTSTTYAVELATLQMMNDIDDPDRLVNYYYAYGEPELNDGTLSEIVSFEEKDKLQLVRVEINDENSFDNVYDWENEEEVEYDLDLQDGVNAKVNETLSLYGVVAPIQIDKKDIGEVNDNSYSLNNKVQSIHYHITGDGIDQHMDKEVLLNRKSGTWDNYSELEFKHDIAITEEMKGKTLTLSAVGYDVHQNKVAGSEETFTINVLADKAITMGVETNDPTQLQLYFNLTIISGVFVSLKLKKVMLK